MNIESIQNDDDDDEDDDDEDDDDDDDDDAHGTGKPNKPSQNIHVPSHIFVELHRHLSASTKGNACLALRHVLLNVSCCTKSLG